MSILRLKFIISFLPLLFLACESGQSPASVNAQSNKGNSNQTKEQKPDSVMIIRQGTVGKIGKFSIGVRNTDSTSARIAIWDSALPQAKRNDYNVSFTVKSGDSIPVGNNFYRVAKIISEEIQIESEPVKTDGLSLQADSLAIPDGGVLELYGYAVEVTSIEAAGGKTSAKVEIYSNDYPKKDLEEKNEIPRLTVASGDEISIGEKKHKIIAVHAGKGNSRGVMEVSFSAVQ